MLYKRRNVSGGRNVTAVCRIVSDAKEESYSTSQTSSTKHKTTAKNLTRSRNREYMTPIIRLIEGGVFGEEDGTEEVVRAGEGSKLAELVGFGNAVGFAGKLLLETSLDILEEHLFLRRGKRGVGLPRINKLLGVVGGLSEGLLVLTFVADNRVGYVVAFVWDVAFKFADTGNVSFEIMKDLLTLNETILGVSSNGLFYVGVVNDCCHK